MMGKQLWELIEPNEQLKNKFKQYSNLPEIICHLLASRISDIPEIEHFLNPKIKHAIPEPYELKDMEKAVLKIFDGCKRKQKIAIFGDYDVDGATSAAILYKFFKLIRIETEIYIPDRIEEGYGPNTNAFRILQKNGANIVITVDCGTVAFEPIETAMKQGLDVIVVDHHISASKIPVAVAVINPNRLDEDSEYKYLSGVGVAFLLIVAINRFLRENSFYKENNITEPKIYDLLDLVALGTVCDVVPLVGLNRAFVTQGLRLMSNTKHRGLFSLLRISNLLDSKITAYHLGFIIGPKINAGGRIGCSSFGAKLLANNNSEESDDIAKKLTMLNEERKVLEDIILAQAITQVQENNLDKKPMIIISDTSWHQGVIGIVASRIKERYKLPTIVISINEEDIGKASCRSINGINIGALILEAMEKKIIIEGGGHDMAAGFSIDKCNIDKLDQFLTQKLSADIENIKRKNTLRIDTRLPINAITLELFQNIQKLAPFGTKNPTPKFLIENCYIIKSNIMKGKHLSLIISDQIQGVRGKSARAIAWKAIDNEIGDVILNAFRHKRNIDMVVTLHENHWNNKTTIDLFIDDVR